MKDQKILVTGGAGFIGSHLVEELCKNNDVIVLDNLLRGNKIPKSILPKVNLIIGDIRDQATVMELSSGCSYIFHLAALLGVDIVADNPTETMDTEIIGMKNISKAALKNAAKVIYASTSGIYGHSAIEKSVTEDIMVDPRTSYAIAKRYNEIYLAVLYEEKGLKSIALRYFNVYGQRQDKRMVTPRFIEQARRGEPLTIYGNGNQTRDFTFISDTIKSTIEVASKVSKFEIFNVANENEVTINTLAEKIVQLTNSKSQITKIDAPKKRYDYEVERRFGNSQKLENYIGFKPSTNLEEGLKKMLISM